MDIKRTFFDGARTNYHHGRLKDALIDAARDLVAERGPAGFTLAEAAKRVGVTGAAPYRHFADRGALMQELALRGFAQFDQRLGEAWQNGTPDATTAMRRMGRAYLAFSREEPGLYSAMFGHISTFDTVSAAAVAAQALDRLLIATTAVLAQHGVTTPSTMLAYEIWSLSHGVAMLGVAGFLSAAQTGCSPEDLHDHASSSMIEMAIARAKGR